MPEQDYVSIQNAIAAALAEDLGGADSPFVGPGRRIVAEGSQLADAEFAASLERLKPGPAAVILFNRATGNQGRGGVLDEDIFWHIVVLEQARTAEAAVVGDTQSEGILNLMTWVKKKLHNNQTIGGLPDCAYYVQSAKLAIPNTPLTVAAFVAEYRTPLPQTDGWSQT